MSPILLDLIFIGCALMAIFAGYRRGLIGQVVWFISSFIGFALAARFSADLAELLDYRIVSKPITMLVSFLLIFLLAIWLARKIGVWLTGLIGKSPVGLVNSVLGAIFSFGIFLVIAALISVVAMVIVPDAKETIAQTHVVRALIEPVKAVIDERVFHSSETGPASEPTESDME